MSDLFIGEWDIAGSHIANRLFREGHEVCWICNETTEPLWNSDFRGKIYQGLHSRDEFSRILKTNNVENVVFMCPQMREKSLMGERECSMNSYLAFVLDLLKDYQPGSFVLLSSVELDLIHENTPVHAQLMHYEQMCLAYRDTYQMPILIVRLPMIYSQDHFIHQGYTTWAMNQIDREKTIVCPFEPESHVDLVEAEDIAYAVFALLKNGYTGMYRILSGHPVPIRQYYETLSSIVGKKVNIEYEYKDRINSQLLQELSMEVKLKTGWMPFYLIQEDKGKARLQQAWENRNAEHILHSTQSERKQSHHRTHAFVEILVLFIGMEFLLQLTGNMSDLKYVDIRLMYVAICCSIHGMAMGTVSIILACISYVMHLYMAHVDISYFLYRIDSWIPFAAYIAMGGFIGYMFDVLRDNNEALLDKYRLLSDKYAFLRTIHQETIEIKKDLQRQITTSKNSFGNLYEVTSRLDSLNPEEIMVSVIGILEDIMHCEGAVIYTFNGEYARVRACSTTLQQNIYGSLKLEEHRQMIGAFQRSEVFVNTDLRPASPDMAAPIYYDGRLYGFIVVIGLPADYFTVFYQNMFRVLAGLIEKNLAKAIHFEEKLHNERYIPDTDLLNAEALAQQMDTLSRLDESQYIAYMICRIIPMHDMDVEEVSRRMHSTIRGNDFMGMNEHGEYIAILMNMNPAYFNNVRERFESHDLEIEVIS